MERYEILYGQTSDGPADSLLTMTNRSRASLPLTNFGEILTAITVPDRNGQLSKRLSTNSAPKKGVWER